MNESSEDPRKMTVAELNDLGFQKRPILSAIRENCIGCAGGSPAEVRRCHLTKCPLWPYRMGTNPFTGRKGNPAAFKKAGNAMGAQG